MKSAVTISLVNEARGGPFVFWDDLPGACRAAQELGFDAIELFAPGPEAVDVAQLHKLLDDHRLKLAAVGTGAGWVKHKLNLTLPDAAKRQQAQAFIRSMIDLGGPFGAPAIIGSMQGRWGDGTDAATAHGWLAEGLNALAAHAGTYRVPLIYEPLNRYETNMATTVEQGLKVIENSGSNNVVLLADLFHMNIEEVDIAAALRSGGTKIGHVHFVDSNRRAAGLGHMDYRPVIGALRAIGYQGYLSAEVLSWPDPMAAARKTIETYRQVLSC